MSVKETIACSGRYWNSPPVSVCKGTNWPFAIKHTTSTFMFTSAVANNRRKAVWRHGNHCRPATPISNAKVA